LTEPRATPALGRPNLDSNWSATSATPDGTVRIRESVPDRRPQPPGFAGVRVFGTVRAEETAPAESTANGLASRSPCGAIQAGSRKRDPALFNSGLGERSPGPLRFSPTFPRPSTLGVHHARVDSVRAESATGVKERATRAFWTAFALSLLARGERGTERHHQPHGSPKSNTKGSPARAVGDKGIHKNGPPT